MCTDGELELRFGDGLEIVYYAMREGTADALKRWLVPPLIHLCTANCALVRAESRGLLQFEDGRQRHRLAANTRGG